MSLKSESGSRATSPSSGASNRASTKAGDEQQHHQQKQALDIYKKALTFNVIAKYDPKINELMHLSSYAVVYQFDGEDWNKLEYNGPIALYSRHYKSIPASKKLKVSEILRDDYYQFGLIILNRAKPENFTVGLLDNSSLADEDADKAIMIERKEELVIVRDFKGDTFGLWLFNPNDREYLYKYLKYCVDEGKK